MPYFRPSPSQRDKSFRVVDVFYLHLQFFRHSQSENVAIPSPNDIFRRISLPITYWKTVVFQTNTRQAAKFRNCCTAQLARMGQSHRTIDQRSQIAPKLTPPANPPRSSKPKPWSANGKKPRYHAAIGALTGTRLIRGDQDASSSRLITSGKMRSTMTATPSALGCMPSSWLRSGSAATPSRKNG